MCIVRMLVCVCSVLHALFFNMSLLISAAIVDRAPSGRPGRPAACGCATPRSPREAAPAAGRGGPRETTSTDARRRRRSIEPRDSRARRPRARDRDAGRCRAAASGDTDSETRERHDRGAATEGAGAAARARPRAHTRQIRSRLAHGQENAPYAQRATGRAREPPAPRCRARRRSAQFRSARVKYRVACRRGPVGPSSRGRRTVPCRHRVPVERAGFGSLLFKKPYRVRRTGATVPRFRF